MLVCTHFANTSIVAEKDGGLVGLISGYAIPDLPEVFFVWQVAVDPEMRGKGLAKEMAMTLLKRDNLTKINFIDTTISPSNTASQSLFKRIAASLQTNIVNQPLFDKSLFGQEAHEDEELYRIGPIINDNAS
jgi:L-2,4-diaminobutyric acid acetyltransferase